MAEMPALQWICIQSIWKVVYINKKKGLTKLCIREANQHILLRVIIFLTHLPFPGDLKHKTEAVTETELIWYIFWH